MFEQIDSDDQHRGRAYRADLRRHVNGEVQTQLSEPAYFPGRARLTTNLSFILLRVM